MRLRIDHTTTFEYNNPISEAYTEMRLKPLEGNGQHVLSFSLSTEPRDEVMQYLDRFGNDVHHFDVIQPHRRLLVRARSEVITPERFTQSEVELSPLDQYDYLNSSQYAPVTTEIAEFAHPHNLLGAPAETAIRLMNIIFEKMKYQKGATDVTTNAAQVLQYGRGVCQDFAHLMLAACRSQGITARYVSGYLYSIGHSTATHAWVDVFLPGQGWISLDPTHNSEQSGAYVRLATGRDYADVPPTRGIFIGNAKEQMTVQVRVQA